MATAKRPWVKWYGGDWRKDVRLRKVGYAARGLWADMLALMQAETDQFGFLIINGEPLGVDDIVGIFGGSAREVSSLMQKLEAGKVFSRVGNDDIPREVSEHIPADMPKGTILSRRMVKDKAQEEVDRLNGKGGGNPRLKEGDKPSDKPPGKPPGKPKTPTDGLTPPVKAQSQSQSQRKKEINPAQPSLSAARGSDAPSAPDDPKALAARANAVRVELMAVCGVDENRRPAWASYGAIVGWLQAGADPDLDILPTAKAVAARLGDGNLRSPAGLTDAVLDAMRGRKAAVQSGSEPAPPRESRRQSGRDQPGDGGLHPDWRENQWRGRMRGLGEFGLWLDSWGPKPGERGCGVPKEILAEFADQKPADTAVRP